ncbi:MAG: tyrosine-type recombinase/integrase [Acidobacteriaceae bacterium]
MKAPDEGNIIQYDGEIPGFGVRVTAAGAVSFILEYRIHGRKRRFTIGRYPELTATAARARALELRGMIYDKKNPRDPMEEQEQSRIEPTVKDLADRYLEEYAEVNKRPASVRNDRQMINRLIVPRIGKLRLKAIGKRDVELLHASLKPTPYQANRVLSLLSKMFNKAIDWDWMTKNFAHKMPRCHEEKRESCLSVAQIQRFREALDAYSDQNAADALRLLLLTGSRTQEVLKAEWEQFDLERKVWTKPSLHTKQKKTEHVPLSAPAVELLRKMKPKNATGPLFLGKENEDGEQVARTTIRRPWIQACKAAGLVKETTVKKGKRKNKPRYLPTVHTKDLRHSFASHLVSNGVGLQIVGKLLGHTQAATTMRYSHIQDEALRAATNQLADIYTMTEKKGA